MFLEREITGSAENLIESCMKKMKKLE